MAKNKGTSADDTGEEGGKKGGKLKLIAIVLPVLLLVGGGVYFFVLAPGSDSETSASASAHGEKSTPSPPPVPGAVVEVAPVTINLAGGHYLKVGLALQATKDAGEEVPPGKAADALITQFSGRTVDELATAEGREAAKKELLTAIAHTYEEKVYEIYFTTFVMN